MRRFFGRALASVLMGRAIGLDWQNEVNVSMCNWAQLRANVIRNTIYLDGGSLWWQIGLSDGTYATPQSDGNVDGLVYALDLGQPFDANTNQTALFANMSKTGGLASNNIAPNYIDGAMFANDDELILYGGLTALTDSQNSPDAETILGYEAYQYGPNRASWQAGFIVKTLPSTVTRYVTNGAGVSAPSENLGFYFSGMRAVDWGLIQDGDQSANTTANTLITVDMSTMRGEKWSNTTLPDNIPGRANAELAWVPVSKAGILVAIGGVIDPSSLTAGRALNSTQEAASNETSPTFMETVSVYDIGNKKWHLQNTTGDIPSQRTLFCSVVAAAEDGSSYNIYIYGGYDGLDDSHAPTDDVYILSIPSFIWVKAYSGDYAHGRSGHKCVKTYPDKMFVLGGIFKGSSTVCLDGGIIQVFNLNTLRFQDTYDPDSWSNYVVPDLVTAQIGGDGNGSATKTSPSAWNEDSLSAVFQTKYTKTISTYYPYPIVSSTSSPTSTSTSSPGPTISVKPSSGLPTWVGPVLGVVLGLIVIAAAVILWLIWRRRRIRSAYGSGSNMSHEGGYRTAIMKWLYGTPASNVKCDKGPSEMETEDIDAPETVTSVGSPNSGAYEAGSEALHEMDARPSARFELPTEYNTAAAATAMNWQPSLQNNISPSHNGVVMSGERQVPIHDGTEDITPISAHSSQPPIRPTHHRHQNSDVSNPLSDVSELSELRSDEEPAIHARNVSDVSNVSSPAASTGERDGAFQSPIQSVGAMDSVQEEKHEGYDINDDAPTRSEK